MGCVIAELLSLEPLFAASTEVEMMVQIMDLLGKPTQDQVRSMNPNSNVYGQLPDVVPCGWKNVFKRKMGSEVEDYLRKLIVYDPSKRLTPLESLLHPF